MANNVATYSGGIGGGSALKFAVKLPNLVILSVDSGLSELRCKIFRTGLKKDDVEGNL